MELHGSGIKLISDQGMDVFSQKGNAEETVRFSFFSAEKAQEDAFIEFQAISRDSGVNLEFVKLGREIEKRVAAGESVKAYHRIVKCDDIDEKELPSLDSVQQLAKAMKLASKVKNSKSRAPAAFTYLGQFIAHDMTHMKFDGDPYNPHNYRSQALDLDSIFGDTDQDCDLDGTVLCENGVCLGRTYSKSNYGDLPRSKIGEPCVPDPRNDNNLALSQLTFEIMKFFHSVGRLCCPANAEEQKLITMRHFQSIVLHDYLEKICHDQVYQDVVSNGRRIVFPGEAARNFRVPWEFAAACFRFGHSQVRSIYDWNKEQPAPDSSKILRLSYVGRRINENKPRLPDNWRIDWDRFLGKNFTDSRKHFTSAIDWNIATSLNQLHSRWVDGPGNLSGGLINLAEITLNRSIESRLPTAQILRREIIPKLSIDSPEIYEVGRGNLFSGSAQKLSKYMDISSVEELSCRTPLWFYILREAEVFGVAGRHLGPLCSRVVAETIHAAIEAEPNGILGKRKKFCVHPNLRGERSDKFTFREMININKSIKI